MATRQELRGRTTPSATRVANIAHRGASLYAPEHTFAAYDLAGELGADYIEQDLHMTADGELVVIHDAKLDRTARSAAGPVTGWVTDKTSSELAGCEVGSWFNRARPDYARPEFSAMKIPSLDDLFTRYGNTINYYIEAKLPELYPGMEEELVRLIVDHGLAQVPGAPWQVVVQSFSPVSLLQVHELAPYLPLIQLFSVQGARRIQSKLAEVRTYASGIGVFKTSVDSSLVETAHACDLCVHAYTVNDQREMKRLLRMNVDGIFTDVPDRLDDVVTALSARSRSALA